MPHSRLRQYLRTARLSAGLTQPEVGELLGVSFKVVSNVECGATEATLPLAMAASILFGKPIEELFPAKHRELENRIAEQAFVLERRLKCRRDPASRKKRALLAKITGSPEIPHEDEA